ncbi:MAG: hypothetical protein HY719_13755, partial [Planctomycetes bacterium]|nr:hypothetical protein [Planctomycetota bacterium]
RYDALGTLALAAWIADTSARLAVTEHAIAPPARHHHDHDHDHAPAHAHGGPCSHSSHRSHSSHPSHRLIDVAKATLNYRRARSGALPTVEEAIAAGKRAVEEATEAARRALPTIPDLPDFSRQDAKAPSPSAPSDAENLGGFAAWRDTSAPTRAKEAIAAATEAVCRAVVDSSKTVVLT